MMVKWWRARRKPLRKQRDDDPKPPQRAATQSELEYKVEISGAAETSLERARPACRHQSQEEGFTDRIGAPTGRGRA